VPLSTLFSEAETATVPSTAALWTQFYVWFCLPHRSKYCRPQIRYNAMERNIKKLKQKSWCTVSRVCKHVV